MINSKEMSGARQCTGTPSKGRDMTEEVKKNSTDKPKARGTSNKNVRMIRGR